MLYIPSILLLQGMVRIIFLEIFDYMTAARGSALVFATYTMRYSA